MPIQGPYVQRLVHWARQEHCDGRKAQAAAVDLYQTVQSFAAVARMGRINRQWVHHWWTRLMNAGKNKTALKDRPSCTGPDPLRTRRAHRGDLRRQG
jgi:hypothetical protein